MDDFNLQGHLLTDALDKIAAINKWLGGNQLTIKSVKKLLKDWSKEKPVHIVDLGCGNGDMLRSLANYGCKNDFNFKLTGIDANAFTTNYAKQSSLTYPNIEYVAADILEFDFKQQPIDIVLCTLTLHHFKNEQIMALLNRLNQTASKGIVVNDLHRSKIAYYLFQLLCLIFRLNRMSKEDGLTSILRGFTKDELVSFSKNLKFARYSIVWKWAFRYQWIIYKS
ncbi:methyltransferase domain-containing protein [Flavobacterium sp. CYK-4]|nr:methyltransferase domain-containing protein [Flavobacterium lotistagni]